MVFADKILNLRYKRGIEKGIDLGREQGVLQERARWESYSQAVDEAYRKGEPPPAPPTDQDVE